jgi:co-chaperonin GroES (HSP10)
MGASVTERGNCQAEATEFGGGIVAPAVDEPAGASVGLTVTQDRVLIRADREDRAPQQTASGIYLAQSLAAAVDGSDSGESWFVGTIVQLGPAVRRFDVRETVHDWLLELEQVGHDISPVELKALRMRIRALPKECVDPLNVGDRVVFSWASGQQIAVGEDRYVLLRVDDVLGIVEDN